LRQASFKGLKGGILMAKEQKTRAELEEMFRYRMAGLPINRVEVRPNSYGWTVRINAHPRVAIDMQTRAETIADTLRQSFDLRATGGFASREHLP
jgi:hypothetical protein